MLNDCFIQYERNCFDEFIVNARNLLFGNIIQVLDNDNIHGNKFFIYLKALFVNNFAVFFLSSFKIRF